MPLNDIPQPRSQTTHQCIPAFSHQTYNHYRCIAPPFHQSHNLNQSHTPLNHQAHLNHLIRISPQYPKTTISNLKPPKRRNINQTRFIQQSTCSCSCFTRVATSSKQPTQRPILFVALKHIAQTHISSHRRYLPLHATPGPSTTPPLPCPPGSRTTLVSTGII